MANRNGALGMTDFIIPTVIEQTHRGERGWDIFSRLLKDRIVFLGTPIDDDVANVIIAQLLFLESRGPGQGHHALHQLARAARSRPAWRSTTRCSTCAATSPPSAWARRPRWARLLLAAGAKGKRYALPNARIMIHQPLGGFQGQATDIEIHAKEILQTRDTLNEMLAKHTGQPIEQDQERHRARLLHVGADRPRSTA